MNTRMTRRQFGGLLASGASLAVMASVNPSAMAAGPVRLIWWGNPDRDKRTNAVIDLYQKTAGVTVTPEVYVWNDYWQKLATQAAGRALPDVIQMDYRYIFEWARRGSLAALDGFVGKQLQLADFDKNQLESGKVDGKLYGVSMGANSMSHVYNKAVLNSLGVKLPDSTKWTIEDWAKLGNEIKGKLPAGMFFTANMGYEEPRLETWMRQRGKALYTADGKLGYDLTDLEESFAFWLQMQKDGLTPPPDLQAASAAGGMELHMVSTKKAVFGFLHSNQLVALQKLVPDEIDLVMIPNKGGKAGQYLKPSMFLSMAETAADKDAAAKLLNYFITDEPANDLLQIERGVSGDESVRKRLIGALSPTEKKIIDYLNVVSTFVGPLPPPPPQNAGELDRALRPAWESVAFGKVDVKTAAKTYYDNAKAILARA